MQLNNKGWIRVNEFCLIELALFASAYISFNCYKFIYSAFKHNFHLQYKHSKDFKKSKSAYAILEGVEIAKYDTCPAIMYLSEVYSSKQLKDQDFRGPNLSILYAHKSRIIINGSHA